MSNQDTYAVIIEATNRYEIRLPANDDVSALDHALRRARCFRLTTKAGFSLIDHAIKPVNVRLLSDNESSPS
ncbi:hypothetical protein [Hyphomicrobium sp. CS1BSMeth3]|uniref:hypothetical protein n=1 Tax=Hyphomicrobium sp. CS1BSMeth3 TaxID=1892844 RepID=UPI000932051E|nr:hypothetical protein [Hyphomicrobium sp. CS1BSMeth3]